MIVSVDTVLNEMAALGMLPAVSGLPPLEAADLVHAEAQFLVMRAALRAIATAAIWLLDISIAFPGGTGRGVDRLIARRLAWPAGGNRHRHRVGGLGAVVAELAQARVPRLRHTGLLYDSPGEFAGP
jgi:hypothetical protein